MPDPADPRTALGDLASSAHATRVVVIGAGIAGLVAAWECAKVGMQVVVVETSDRVGGTIDRAEIDGITIDAGTECYSTRGGAVRALIDELGLGSEVVTPRKGTTWVARLPGGAAAPLPSATVLGIPDNIWAPEVRRIIGWSGSWRAYLDRLRPPLTIGHERSLGTLVRSRMGAAVVERLVAPMTVGVYSLHPDDIDVDVAAPGLNAALTRTGSLSSAVAQLRAERSERPRSSIEGIEGGMSRLTDALADRLRELGADLRMSTRATAVTSHDDGGWTVTTASATGAQPAGTPAATMVEAHAPVAAPAAPAPDETASSAPSAPDETASSAPSAPDETASSAPSAPVLIADRVIVATTQEAARSLLSPIVRGLSAECPATPMVEIVTLAIDSTELRAHGRGTGVFAVPGAAGAQSVTDSTAKWEWIASAAAGTHLLRVSFGEPDRPPATTELSDTDAATMAFKQASDLLGVRLELTQLRGAHRGRYVQAAPISAIGQIEFATAVRESLVDAPGITVVGAWLAGSGLAQVVPDAIREAERVRRATLFDSAPLEE